MPLWQVAFFVTGPLHARDHFGGAAAWGLVTAAFGAGMATGAAISLLAQPPRAAQIAAVGSAALALPPLAMAAGLPLPVVMAATALAATGLAMAQIAMRAAMQHHIPHSVQGRVAVYSDAALVLLAPPLYLAVGPLMHAAGPAALQTGCAAVIAVASLAPLASPTVRRLALAQ
ncbi:MFS transporter [Actinomadura macrotermitis]|uniref:MFS transporter n=1 Tax=Actinomadura macrotermitis TaxID=2585200 RepID=A0A7K0C2Q8_9ACTN|nr:hypothetical protein [Actinomadura macrotermitis]MQY07646.1 hypothetical protein [Actinomadura macrotermitis]